MTSAKRLARWLVRTPLHPQWLLGPRVPPAGISSFRGRLLDIGAADKWLAAHLGEGVEYVALDYPTTGRDLYGARPDVFADAARLPFADASMDGIACLEVIEHVSDPAAVLGEMSRVLRGGGKAWLTMPFLYPVHDAPHDYQRFTEHGLRHAAAKAGLEVEFLGKTGHAVRSAGLLGCLAVAGGAIRRKGMGALLLWPLAGLAILAINVAAFALSLVWPDWDAMGMGHEMVVRKP